MSGSRPSRRPAAPRSLAGATTALLAAAVLGLVVPAPPGSARAVPGAASERLTATDLAAEEPGPAGRTGRPDIVLVVTDDQRQESLSAMPHLSRDLVARGTTFSNAVVPTSLCCPSRSSILTGLYSHTTGVYGNGRDRPGGIRLGGWTAFNRAGWEKRTLPLALQRAGYRTGLFGKYLNDFAALAPDGYQPPGWDEFLAFDGPNSAYVNYRLTDGSRYGAGPDDYSTDVLAARAAAFIEQTERGTPLFVMVTPYGPHQPFRPAERHRFSVVAVPKTAGERPGAADLVPDTSPTSWPAPPWRSELPGWALRRQGSVQRELPVLPVLSVLQTRTLLSVDEAVASLVDTLRAERRLHNTLFVFMSDNGFLWGEHGLVGKDAPYAAAARIPLVLRWDGHVAAGATDERLALNLDVTATLAAAAGVSFPTEGWDLTGDRRRPGAVVEAATGNGGRPAYCGWRTTTHLYVRYADGRTELYDYRTDPGERHNLAGVAMAAGTEREMRAAARQACVPRPPGFRW